MAEREVPKGLIMLPGGEALLTVDEIAAILKVNRQTIYYYVRVHRMPYLSLPTLSGKRRFRFLLSAVLDWLKNSPTAPVEPSGGSVALPPQTEESGETEASEDGT